MIITGLILENLITCDDTQFFEETSHLGEIPLLRLIYGIDCTYPVIFSEGERQNFRAALRCRYESGVVKEEDAEDIKFRDRISALGIHLFCILTPRLKQKEITSISDFLWSILIKCLSQRLSETPQPDKFLEACGGSAKVKKNTVFSRLGDTPAKLRAELEKEQKTTPSNTRLEKATEDTETRPTNTTPASPTRSLNEHNVNLSLGSNDQPKTVPAAGSSGDESSHQTQQGTQSLDSICVSSRLEAAREIDLSSTKTPHTNPAQNPDLDSSLNDNPPDIQLSEVLQESGEGGSHRVKRRRTEEDKPSQSIIQGTQSLIPRVPEVSPISTSSAMSPTVTTVSIHAIFENTEFILKKVNELVARTDEMHQAPEGGHRGERRRTDEQSTPQGTQSLDSSAPQAKGSETRASHQASEGGPDIQRGLDVMKLHSIMGCPPVENPPLLASSGDKLIDPVYVNFPMMYKQYCKAFRRLTTSMKFRILGGDGGGQWPMILTPIEKTPAVRLEYSKQQRLYVYMTGDAPQKLLDLLEGKEVALTKRRVPGPILCDYLGSFTAIRELKLEAVFGEVGAGVIIKQMSEEVTIMYDAPIATKVGVWVDEMGGVIREN